MTKARDLADLIAAGSVLADGTVEAADISDLTATAAELNLLDGVTATTAELNYVDGVTSAIQTQIDTKAPTASPTFTGTITFPAGQTFDGRDVSADGIKLDGIEASADVTDTTNVSAAGALMKSGGTMTGAITFAAGQTFDGRDVSADGSKLDGIESGATADQTKADIDGLGINAATLDGVDSSQFLRSDANDTTTGSLTVDNALDINNGNGTQTHWNYANGSANYIRGTNTTFDTPIDMNNNTITDSGDIYTNDWFRNNNAGEGLYNEATGAHIASDATDQWTFRDAGTSMRLLLKTENANHRGSVYATNSNDVGFLDAGTAWSYRHRYNQSHHWNIANVQFMELNNDGLFLADGNLKEDYDALSGTTPNCNSNSGGAFSLTMTGNTTFTFSAGHSGYSQGFVLQLTGNGSTVTWPASVDWAGGTAPDAPANGETDLLVFWTRDGGTTWYGMLAVDAAA